MSELVLLAYLSESEQDDLIGNTTQSRRGPNTITNKKALRAELEHVFEEGMAVNDERFAPDLVSIACPIRCERILDPSAGVPSSVTKSCFSRSPLSE